MITRGFRFGMILQLAVGPVCLFIFQTAVSSGLLMALLGVLGVSLVDGAFIIAAILGLGAMLNDKEEMRKAIKLFGALILILFGASTILGTMGISILPSLSLGSAQSVENVFTKTMLLTLSNPLTILFWAGVFSSKVAEDKMTRNQMYEFGLGAVMSTVLFLSSVALMGNVMNVFLSGLMMNVLNIVVGCVLIGFGIRSFLK